MSEHDNAARQRAQHESNYGYESDHPSYRARGAGDWSGRTGRRERFEQGSTDQSVDDTLNSREANRREKDTKK
ncbi:hypothetical protein [Hydrogenophaga sp.]|uniref:hypothetical protein n=1 Tax=Hydrogenophaga sp. TaxID=1904254 RepID=UPI0025BC2D3D|nr:hypothetical protein [Hydrogenophaga sp.]MBT9463022.1 hypothetical protein [Hydrogenophaga sp.]